MCMRIYSIVQRIINNVYIAVNTVITADVADRPRLNDGVARHGISIAEMYVLATPRTILHTAVNIW